MSADSKQQKKLWFSPHGTEWEAETYEEALEQERDSLFEQLQAVEGERERAKFAALETADALVEAHEQLEVYRSALEEIAAPVKAGNVIANDGLLRRVEIARTALASSPANSPQKGATE